MEHDGTNQRLERPREQWGSAETAPAGGRRVEEAAWIRRMQAGDLSPFADLVRRYQDQVYNTCWRICGNVEDAHDVAQDAFLKALDSIGDFHGRSAFYTWLFRIAVNLAISQRRRSRQRMMLSLDGSGGSRTDADANARLSEYVADERLDPPEKPGERRELQRVLAAALDGLDDDYRTVVVLRDIEGFDYDEIAAVLSVPRGTVKSRLHRARQALRQALERAGVDDPGRRPRAEQPAGSSRGA